jgi:putative glutathione S-transferase
MGHLVDGVWTEQRIEELTPGGRFIRRDAIFRNWITADGNPGPSGEGGFPAESGRYHLYVSYACPWAHRTLIFRALKDLTDHIGVSIVHPDMLSEGWTFATDFPGTTGDTLYGLRYARDVYLKSDPRMSGRVTVPILWDKKREVVVSNESSEIIRMFNNAFDEITGNSVDFWPESQRDAIEVVNDRVYNTLNNGVYKCGFAQTQAAYDDAVGALFDTLDWLEARLDGRDFLVANQPTEADWRTYPTLARFDAVYHGHFKCNRNRIIDFPNLWRLSRRLYQWPGVAETTRFDHFTRHYYYSHETINPRRIVPIGPVNDWNEPV